MATQSPIPFLDNLFDKLGNRLQPPTWVIDEIQRRMVLLLNHVLMQEPEAQARLARQAGRVVEARWRVFVVRLAATPAGLLDLAVPTVQPDLTLTLTDESPWDLTQAALRGDKPAVRIVGDVQFAAEVNWLVDHVRWDLEEDLSRLIGDAPAHTVGQTLKRMVDALRKFTAAPSARSGREPVPGSGQAPSSSSGQGGA